MVRVRQLASWTTKVITLLFVLALPLETAGQDASYPDRARGLILDTEEDLKGVERSPTYKAYLPERVDLSRYMPPPGNQGKQGSCTAWAVGYAARGYYAAKIERRNNRDTSNVPSPAYIYNTILENPADCHSGSKISKALQLLSDNGALSLKHFPYSSESCPRPNQTALDFKISSFQLIPNERLNSERFLDDVKGELAQSSPVMVSFDAPASFSALRAGQIYNAPSLAQKDQRGFHALTVVGYDERRQSFKVINSWGADWGDKGYGWIAYDTFKRNVPHAYVMHLPEPRIQPPVDPEPKPSPVVNPEPRPSPVVPQPPSPTPQPIAIPDDLKCSKLEVLQRADGARVTGFVGSMEDLERVRSGAGSAGIYVQLRPWPQCEALETLEKPLGRSDRPKVAIRKSQGETLVSGEDLVFEIETPGYPSYLHVAYFQADGSVVNLLQPGIGSFSAYKPHTKLALGIGPGRRFRVSAPFGREMLLVLAARSPIFVDRRPDSETYREFLTALRRELIAQSRTSPREGDVAAAYDAIVTAERRTP